MDLALEALRAVERGARADRTLRATLRANRGLSADDRATLADLVLGVTAKKRALEHAAGPALAAQIDAFKAGIPPAADPAVRASVSDAMYALVKHALGASGAEAFFTACARRGPLTLRTNPLRATRDEVRAALESPATDTPRSPHGLRVQGRLNVRGNVAWQAGHFEVQDEGSQCIALATEAAPGERVLDLCAGRGGKTLALLAMMEGRGEVCAYDPDTARLRDLRVRLPRAMDAPPVRVEAPNGLYDRVLVDAPCSEIGTLRRSPDLRAHFREGDVERCAALQREILTRAAAHMRGVLVYATCTVTRAENEDMTAWACETLPLSLEHEERLTPHEHDTDGFYIARFRRR